MSFALPTLHPIVNTHTFRSPQISFDVHKRTTVWMYTQADCEGSGHTYEMT